MIPVGLFTKLTSALSKAKNVFKVKPVFSTSLKGAKNIQGQLSAIKGVSSADVTNFTRRFGKFQRKAVRKEYLNKLFPTSKGVSLKEKIPNFLIKKSPAKYMDKGYANLLSGHSKTYFKELGRDIKHPFPAMKRVWSTTKYNVKPSAAGLSITKKSPVGRGISTGFTYGIPAWFAVEPWTAKRFKDSGKGGKTIASMTGGIPDLFTRKFIPIMAFNHLSEAMAKNKSAKAVGNLT